MILFTLFANKCLDTFNKCPKARGYQNIIRISGYHLPSVASVYSESYGLAVEPLAHDQKVLDAIPIQC